LLGGLQTDIDGFNGYERILLLKLRLSLNLSLKLKLLLLFFIRSSNFLYL